MSGHCCACSGFCQHVSPPTSCEAHKPVPPHCCGCGRTPADVNRSGGDIRPMSDPFPAVESRRYPTFTVNLGGSVNAATVRDVIIRNSSTLPGWH